MQRNNSPQLRVLYIILVPIVVLIIILNSGFLQKALPAARIHGSSYSVVRYNYYYYDFYNRFLDDNEDRLEDLGYNPKLSAGSQTCSLEDDTITWKEYFQRNAERNMSETAYYCDLAKAAGYEFAETELRPIQEKLSENAAFQAANNISAKNYYIAYYGSGVTEQLYTAELTRQVKAQAYKAYLAATAPVPAAELEAYMKEHPANDYRTADIRVITLEAQPDRETGKTGPEQLDALSQKMQRLVLRYESGESFESLQSAFSTCSLGDREGYLYGATRTDVPASVAETLFFSGGDTASYQNGILIGNHFTALSEDTAYFVILDAWGDSGAEREARNALGMELIEKQEEAALSADYAVVETKPGILLATG